MSDFDFDLDGATSLKEEFGDRIADWSKGGSVYVGTAVEYSVFLEFGTSKMDPKPFFRPALAEAKADPEAFIREHTRTLVARIDSARELVRVLALAMERRVKEIITEKGLIDTGTLRASVLAVPTASALPDEGDLPDGNEVSPTAGRAAASESIDL